MKCIITTTIYPPSEATLKFCEKKDWHFIIVGDLKTPHDEYIELERTNTNVRYLTPDYQAARYPEISNSIGWNTIQRRNIGLIEAYKTGAEIVATVDDDNIPYETWGQNIYVNKTIEVDLFSPKAEVFDPLSVTKHNNLWHRGFPIDLLQQRNEIEYKGKIKRRVLVQSDLWDGDPDIDALARIAFRPNVRFDDVTQPFCSDKISPFNSQNTFLSREVIPHYAMLPFVGRMDDIWASYILQLYFPQSVIYCPATVFQNRNKQDLIVNLEKEMPYYRDTLKLIQNRKAFDCVLPQKTLSFYHLYRKQFENA